MQNKNRMLLVLGLMAFLANGDNYAAAPLLINISNDLNLSASTAALSVTAYMLSFGVFTLIFGPLADRFGKVKIINIAAIGTAIFSMLGATAFSLPSLIFFRAMNGAFGAGIFPVTMALVGESFDDNNRQKALGKVMGMMFLGAATATIMGGVLAYIGSWRLVYLVYGVGELILALIMFKILARDKPVVEKLNLLTSYKTVFKDYRFVRLVTVILFVGFSVFGSFTYTGKLVQELTGYNIFIVGIILSVFGFGTVIGGRLAPKIRTKLKNSFLAVAGLLGSISLLILALSGNIVLLILGFLGFGIAFISLQSTLIATAQRMLPKMKGTAMSMASFNMFVGGALGTSLNGIVMDSVGLSQIFINASILILIAGIVSAIFVSKFEMKQQMKLEEIKK